MNTMRGVLLAASFATPLNPVLADAARRFEQIQAYHTLVKANLPDGRTETIRYWYKARGWIRMEFVEPHPGALLLFDPDRRQARVWPFGSSGPSFAMSPDNPLIRSSRGHRVDQSDLGSLLANMRELAERGSARGAGEERIDHRDMLHVRVEGRSGEAVQGVHRYEAWFDRETMLPHRVESYDERGRPVEAVVLADLVVDPPLRADFFEKP